ncbi:MAG TPA: protein kinase [Pirellulaceae bacterium]|nr:protein kinase [Pirellulaceae bacterium]
MAHSNDLTERLIAQAKLGEEAAFVNLIAQVGPRLRRAIDGELYAVRHDLDAVQMWNEIQDEARRQLGEFQGSTEDAFEAWAERLALRHIRQSVRGRAGNVETVFNAPRTHSLAEPTQTSDVPQTSELSKDTTDDPNATLAPHRHETVALDPNATIALGGGGATTRDPFATVVADPDGTITNLASIPLAPQTAKIFGDYEILETIAKGGMGVVYKARQRKLNRIVALKMILAGQFADQGDIERFYAEAEAAAHLRHPNIVGIHEVGECEGQHYFSMEYIEGKSLGDLVREHPLAPRTAAKFVKTISEAMHYAHEEGVLHRDLKPSNVLVDGNEVPLVTDFGLAKRSEGQSQLTMAGTVLGTPSYMPPEQAAGKLDQISARSDVYSLGAILYELITGKPPFGAANPWETIKQVLNTEPVSPRLLNSGVPADLETICLKCLQKDQDRRYGSAQDLADELQRFLAGEPILARPVGIAERAIRWCYRNPWPTAALAVLLFAVVGISGALIQTDIARDQAEVARQQAVVSRDKARIAQRQAEVAQHQAELSRDQLLAAINELFTAWGDVTLLNEPGFEDVRAQLLATASNLYKQMGDQLGDDPKIQQELGVSYFRLGRMMFHLRSYENARESLEAALKIQRTLHAAQPTHEGRLHALGESLNLLGNVWELLEASDQVTSSGTERLEKAESVYDEAIAARSALVTQFPEEPTYRRQLLNSRMNRGMVRQRMGDLFAEQEQLEKAEAFYSEARVQVEEVQAGIRDLLAQLDETSDVRRDVLQDLAQCSYNIANVTWWLGDFNATGEHVQAAVAAFETLLAENPNSLANQYDQAHCLMLGGDAKSEQMRSLDADNEVMGQKLYNQALQEFERAKTTLERLANKSTSVPKYRFGVTQASMRIGDLYLLRQEDHKALAAYQSAAAILTSMVVESPAYQPFLDVANGAIAEVERYIKEAAAAALPADEAETKK